MWVGRRASLCLEAGQVFGRLTVLDPERRLEAPRPDRAALCVCECGEEKLIRLSSLVSGLTTSCGCRNIEKMSLRAKERNASQTTHGMSDHANYRRWNDMMRRCYHPQHKSYADYGGRGIAVYEPWHDVAVFIAAMSPATFAGQTHLCRTATGDVVVCSRLALSQAN
jgi:hypothetical protein